MSQQLIVSAFEPVQADSDTGNFKNFNQLFYFQNLYDQCKK